MSDEAGTEGRRARVKRILIDPLVADGMRAKAGSDPEAERRMLDRIADDLGYMTDAGLEAVREWMRTHGEGSKRCFWPPVVTILGVAEAFQARPLEELPALVRWFGSAAGAEALAAGRLVAEYDFWQRHKRPPVHDRDRARVQAQAAEWAGKVARIEDRIGRGVAPFFDDQGFLDWYRATEAKAQALVGSREAAE